MRDPDATVGVYADQMLVHCGMFRLLTAPIREGGPYTSFCSRSTAPIRRTMAASFGKMPATSARRLISPLRRSSGVGNRHDARGAAAAGEDRFDRRVWYDHPGCGALGAVREDTSFRNSDRATRKPILL